MRMGGPDFGNGSELRLGRIVVALVLSFVLALPAFSKTPGQEHCYRKVCHRVKTIAETSALVGRSMSVVASHYDSPLKDRYNRGTFTSSGTKFDADDPTAAASSHFPDGTELLVWNPHNGRAAHVRVTDFGPFMGNRTLDLTRAAAAKLGFSQQGVVTLKMTVLAPPPPDEPNYEKARVYRKVGGFLGVYRKAEIRSLASLLISQAERRRQVGGSVRAALHRGRGKVVVATRTDAVSPGVTKVRFPVGGPVSKVSEGVQRKIAPPITVPDTGLNRYVVASVSPPAGRYVEHVATTNFEKSRVAAAVISVARNDDAVSSFTEPDARGGKSSVFELGTQSLGFLIVALLLTSSIFFSAYYTATRGLVPEGLIEPIPKRRVDSTGLEFAEVEIVVPPARGALVSGSDGGSAQLPATSADTAANFSDATVIKRESKILGSFTTTGAVIVEGYIEGDCICDYLKIGPKGVVSGRIKAKRAVIQGRVDGAVDVADLHVKGEAHLKGEVRYCDLALEQGAVLEAECKRVASM